jgi:hypothetical protein
VSCTLQPNPAKNKITVNFIVPVETKINTVLYDMYGRLVLITEHNTPGYSFSIDISQLANGAYKIHIGGINGSEIIKNFVVCR